MKGIVTPGVLPGLLGQLHAARQSGRLHLSGGPEQVAFRVYRGRLVSVLAADDAVTGADAREALLGTLSWAGPVYYSFEDRMDETPPGAEAASQAEPGAIILEAAHRTTDPEAVRAALGDQDRLLVPNADPMLRYQNLPFTASDAYALSRIDGTSSAREVIQLIPLPAEEVEKSLFALLCTGIIEAAAAPRTRRTATVPAGAVTGPSAPAPPIAPGPPRMATPAPAAPSPPRAAAPAAKAPTATPPPVAPPPPAPVENRKAEIEARRKEILEAYADLKGKTHFEVLGIPRASSLAKVKEAYFGLARRFHPDTQKHPELVDLTTNLEAVFIRLGEAYEVLKNPRSRSQYEEYISSKMPRTPPPAQATAGPAAPAPPDPAQEHEDSRAAFEALRRAEILLEENHTWDAIQLAEGALPRLEGKARQRASILLAKAFLKNPNWVRRAEETLLRVTQEAPKNVEAHFVLAGIYRERGLPSRAATMYRKVMDLQPDHEGAARALADLPPPEPEPPPESGGTSLLKKLFGRG